MRKLHILIISLFIAIPCTAATITVNWDGSGDYLTIQDAIDVAVDGDTVIVAPGTYTGWRNHDLDFGGRAITIRSIDSNDPDVVTNTIIDCSGNETDIHSGFFLSNHDTSFSVLAGLTISNTRCLYNGGVINCFPNGPMIRSYVVLDNYAYDYDGMDFGDCPDPHYPTLLVNDGARHIIDPNVYLGSGIDSELDGQPTISADGDDVNGIPDEDGVYFPSVLFTNCTRDVNVIASCEGMLDAWFDFNADGDWSDPCEQIFASEPLYAGGNILTFSIPYDAVTGETYARFRFSTAGGLEPNGPAPDGEVEDYMVSIETDCGPWWRTLICIGGIRPWRDGEYEDWLQFNKPECWCYPRQCHGDIDGKSFLGKPVTLADLATFRSAFNKTDEQLRLVPNGICADLNHSSFFGKRVSLSDLDIFRNYFCLPESQVPEGCWCGPYWP